MPISWFKIFYGSKTSCSLTFVVNNTVYPTQNIFGVPLFGVLGEFSLYRRAYSLENRDLFPNGMIFHLCHVNHAEKKGEGRSRGDREADNQQLLQLEEKDVVSSVANVLSDVCGPGEWMPMEKLHAEVSLVTIQC